MKLLCRSTYLIWIVGWFPSLTCASSQAGQHSDPIAAVILWGTLIFFFALIGRYIAQYLNQPGVLGELLMGVFFGNVLYFFGVQIVVVLREGPAIFDIIRDLLNGLPLTQAVSLSIPNPYYAHQILAALRSEHATDLIKVSYVLDIFARYGIIFLLFKVGLESSIHELKRTGRQSMLVALIGVIAPTVLGFFVARFLTPDSSYQSDLFVAATLSATSIGITASVLAEMKKLKTREARTILGAAMMDDILGLIILAIVSSMVMSGLVDFWMILRITLSIVLFFTTIVLMGPWIIRKVIDSFQFMESWEARLFISFLFVMILAWFATVVQLAAIIGAFTAGLIIHDGYFDAQEQRPKDGLSIKRLIAPLESILAPLFFVLIGIQVKLESFLDWHVFVMASGLTLAAVLGKLLSGLGAERKDDRLLIGMGMLPRGEVGLVFASVGRTLGVMSDHVFSAIILMVIITTVIAPPLLKARYIAQDKRLKS